MRHLLDLPDIECPQCGRGRLRVADGTLASRALVALHQALLHVARRLLGLRYWCGVCRAYVPMPRELPRTSPGPAL
jgi:hypothetical protein